MRASPQRGKEHCRASMRSHTDGEPFWDSDSVPLVYESWPSLAPNALGRVTNKSIDAAFKRLAYQKRLLQFSHVWVCFLGKCRTWIRRVRSIIIFERTS